MLSAWTKWANRRDASKTRQLHSGMSATGWGPHAKVVAATRGQRTASMTILQVTSSPPARPTVHTGEPLIKTEGLGKRYQDITALDDCTLEVRRGEVFGLLGPNGAGKTTLLRLLMGFLRPTAGWARIGDFDCYEQSVEVHRRVAYLPGDVRLFRSMPARQLLKFFSEIRGQKDIRPALRMAELLDLRLNTSVNQMSTGMRQKLALAATLAAGTDVIVLDEPTANLDPNVRGRVAQLVRQARDDGRTVVFSSHVMSEVEDSCDRVVILRSGQLVHEQVLSQLRRQHRIVAELDEPLPEVPPMFRSELSISYEAEGTVTMETPGQLKPLLGWLATLPIREVRIEPVGLRAVYDRFHPPEANLAGNSDIEAT